MIVGAGTAWAETKSYTITFNDTGTNSDSSTKITTINDIINQGASYVSSISGVSNVYKGRSNRGLKLGTSSKTGSLTLNLSASVKPTKITFSAMQYNASEKSITINGQTESELTSTVTEYTKNYDGNTEISSIAISTPSKRAYITQVSVYYEDGESSGGDSELIDNDLALTNAPIALNFDLYNNSDAQVIHYTTSCTGAVSIDKSDYATFAIDAENKTITVTPKAVTPSAQTITVNQAADETYKAGSATFTLTITDSTPIPTHQVTFSINGVTSSNEVEEGADIEFPDQPADINGFKFVGWSSSVISGTIVEAPEFVTSATMGDADITYYAVFAEETEGEAVEKLTQTLKYDTWTYSGTTTDKSSYRLFGNGAYVESAAFDLSKLSKVKIYGGTFGGSSTYKTVTIGDGTNIWKDVEMTGTNNAREHSFEDGTALSGTKALRVISTCGDGANNGIRISKIEIFTNEPSIAYTNYCTTVSALPKPVITLSTQSIEMTWGDTDKVLTVSAKINNADFDGIITLASSSNNLTIDGSGNIRCDVPGNYVITASIAAKEGEYQAATPVVCNVIVNKKTVTLSFPEAEYTADVNDGFTAPELTNTSSVVVEYSSTDETVATVAADGTVTLKKDGVTTIKATFAGNNFYEAAEASYTLNVNNRLKPGTEGRPYTVAEAIYAIDNSGDVTGVYATGVVSEIVTAYNPQYGNISYNISADGTTEKAQLQAYRGKSYNGEDFTSEDDIQVGDVVVIYGNLKKYNSTYEFDQNNQLVSLIRKGDAGLSYETTAYYVTVGGTFDAPALTNPYDLTVTYSSSDTEVATVNAETGKVTLGSKVGTTTITASFAGNGEYNAASASYTLTVEYPATTTTLNKTAVELDLADDVPTATLVATVKKGEEVIENATITWTSDDEEVATVDNNGVVTAVAKGTATITATFTADGYKTSSATCEVTVINSASGVIDLAKTGTISFSDFSNAGNSYNSGAAKTTELIASNKIGYEWSGNSYMYNNQSWQFQKSNGTATSPVIKSKKGFTVTFNYDNTKPSISVNDEDVEEDMSDSESVTYTVNSTSTAFVINKPSGTMYITSITITPIKDNRTLAFSEPTTEILVNATATNAATATPAGTITYTSSDGEVATVDAVGKVTGIKIGTATITATVAEDADYNEATASYEVTVNGIPAATDIALTATDENEESVALNEIEVGTIGTFAATYTKAADNVTVTYTSDATDVLTIDENVFEAAKGGTANVTVTITPDDTEHYVAVSKVFEVTLLYAQMGTTELTIVNGEVEEQTSGNTLYGTNINLTAMLAANYDGTVTASLTNNAIANVAIEGENITITPKAVGTTTITFTAPATANFEGEVNKTYELTVTAPEGQTACEVIPAEVVLNETFSKCDSNGGNDGDFGTSSTTSISLPNSATDVEGWTLTTAYEADGCVKFGSSKNAGSATTPSLSVSEGKAYTLTFNAAPWNTESATMTVSVSGGTTRVRRIRRQELPL